MPTLPSEPHQQRQVAESFGVDAGRYDRARPRYPDELTTRLAAARVLDVGCGTGIVARALRAAGSSVLGVEPDARMAEFARQDGTPVEVAKFEDWDSGGRVFDAVVAGQAWHWVDPVAGAAKAASVLRPGGRLTVFWNAHQAPHELQDAFGDIYRTVWPEPMVRAMAGQSWIGPYAVMATTASEGIQQAGAFAPAEEWRFEWERVYTRDEWLDQVPTHGGMTRLPADTLAGVLAEIGEVIDRAGGSFVMHYTTIAVTALRAGQ